MPTLILIRQIAKYFKLPILLYGKLKLIQIKRTQIYMITHQDQHKQFVVQVATAVENVSVGQAQNEMLEHGIL